uniref:Putative secreted peptide n=1 Tax=Anopheles braziliensis TaxID=58242 RepID=A0A2M3ZP46_9DIPT
MLLLLLLLCLQRSFNVIVTQLLLLLLELLVLLVLALLNVVLYRGERLRMVQVRRRRRHSSVRGVTVGVARAGERVALVRWLHNATHGLARPRRIRRAAACTTVTTAWPPIHHCRCRCWWCCSTNAESQVHWATR